jgi:hypothetical protein
MSSIGAAYNRTLLLELVQQDDVSAGLGLLFDFAVTYRITDVLLVTFHVKRQPRGVICFAAVFNLQHTQC